MSRGERDDIRATRPDLTEQGNGFGAVDATAANAVAVYRFFDTIHGTQFLTASAAERDQTLATRPDLTYETGDFFYAQSASTTGDVPVYRFFDTKLGTHVYTADPTEYAALTTPGAAAYRPELKAEGVSFYAPIGNFI